MTPTIPMSIIDENDGMKDLMNYFVFKDSKDFVWISSRSGLHRYNGSTIKIYSPSPLDTTSLSANYLESFFVEDSLSNIWFGSFRGLNCYVRDKDHFKSFQYSDTTGMYFLAGMDRHGILWLKNLKNVLTFNPRDEKFTFVARVMPRTRRLELIYNDMSEVQYVVGYSRFPENPGLHIINVSSQAKYDSRIHFDQSDDSTFVIRDVLPDADSILWIGFKNGIGELNLKSRKFKIHTPDNTNTFLGIDAMTFISDSIIMCGSSSSYFFQFNARTKKFDLPQIKHVKKESNMALHTQAIYHDADGGIWLSFYNAGLGYYHPHNLKFKHFYLNLPGKSIHANIYINGVNELATGDILVSTQKQGLFKINPSSFEIQRLRFNRETEFPFSAPAVKRTFIDSKNRVWLVAHGDFYVWNPDNTFTRIQRPHRLVFQSVCQLKSGKILISTSKGIYRPTEHNGRIMPQLNVDERFVENQYSFMAVHENGLVYMPLGIHQLNCYNPNDNFKLVNTIPINYQVNDFAAIPGTNDFLLATNRGAYYYDASLDKLQLIDWAIYGEQDLIFSIVPIAKDEYLMSSDNGIGHINLSTKKSRKYGLEHGTGSVIFNRFSTIKHSNGSVWFGSNHGITVYEGADLEQCVSSSQIKITKLFVNDEEVTSHTDNAGFNISKDFDEVSTSYKNNTIAVSMASLDYAGKDRSVFEYRLMGFEENWVNDGGRGYVRYPNLPSGDYTFEARVRNEPETLTASQWHIRSPLYQRPWFIVLIALVAVSLVYHWMKDRLKRKERLQELKFQNRLAMEQERVRIATDMHDEIGSGLSALNMQATMIAKQVKEKETLRQLESFVQNSRNITLKIREIIWTVNAQNDFIENLVTRLHQYAQEYFINTDISCHFDLSTNIVNAPISGGHRRAIYLTFKEALHNIYKHAEATHVDIQMAIHNDKLNVIIIDNGCGFNTEKMSVKGLGITSMRTRMKDIGAAFEISSNADGTKVGFSYPIHELI
jgi:signal transduction histidine kinase/ligand-binding sensor domain-containing protein